MAMNREAENTFRTLKDEAPLETRPIWCWMGFHKWTKYGNPVRSASSIYVRQGRFCVACNHYNERKFHE